MNRVLSFASTFPDVGTEMLTEGLSGFGSPWMDDSQSLWSNKKSMAFYRIKEAAEKIGVLPHVLRFWESQFPSFKPPKTSRGQRLYSDEDVENFLKIKFLLYNEGYSIPGAKKFLKEQKGQAPQGRGALKAVDEALEKGLCREILKELKDLRDAVKEI